MEKLNLGVKAALFPSPVVMCGTYNEDHSVDVMTIAWAGMAASNLVEINILENHKTTDNIKKRKAFTLAVATKELMVPCDYLGVVSGAKVADKFEKSGLTAVKSEFVDAPVINELPLTMECELVSMDKGPEELRIVGKIKNVVAHKAILGEDGKVDVSRIHAIVWDNFKAGYYEVGEKVGQSFRESKKLDSFLAEHKSGLSQLAGWADEKKEETPSAACGTGCGAADAEPEKKEETPSAACGTVCGAADK